MIKCIIFDLQGIIIENGSKVKEFLISKGYDKEKVLNLTGSSEIFAKYGRGEITFEEYSEKVKEAFPTNYKYFIDTYFIQYNLLSISKSTLKQTLIDKYEINLNTNIFKENEVFILDIIKELSRNYELCLFSDNQEEKFKRIDKKFNISKYFKYKVFSYQYGFNKPDIRLFDKLFEVIPYTPQECVYIDDKDSNIEVGHNIGLHVVLLDNLEK